MDAFPGNEDQASAVAAVATVSQSEFTDCVDRCVVSLMSKTPLATIAATDSGQAQLRAWLTDDAHALEDGRPIDLALFDSTILSVEERLPASGTLARTRLLSAARELAETLYASINARIALET